MSKELMSASDLLFLQTPTTVGKDTAVMSVDQDGDWDLSLFDELEGLGDAEELLQALENSGYTGSSTDLNFDISFPVWNSDGWGDTSNMCTDRDVSVDSLSPTHTLSPVSSTTSVDINSPCSPYSHSSYSINSDLSSFVETPLEKIPVKKTKQIKAKTVPRPIHLCPKVSIQPKPLITTLPITHTAAALQTKTVVFQPVQATFVPVVKPVPATIQPAPHAGHHNLYSQPAQLLSLALDRPTHLLTPAVPPPVVGIPFQNPLSDDDSSISRWQQRMIKNRVSASISRKKKKEYLLSLETRLKVALSVNEKLKNENGTLKRQLEGLMNENAILKETSPKKRAMFLMVILVFLVINIVPMNILKEHKDSMFAAAPIPTSRHLLGFSSNIDSGMGESLRSSSNKLDDLESISEEKALMVVRRDPFSLRTLSPCQLPLNRTKLIKMARELKGWVHRHETERNKNQQNSSTHSRAKTITKMDSNNPEVSRIMTVQYTNSSNKHSSNELQVYFAPHRTYSDFFGEINRRGDTFYVISFRRDHLLLPATNHNRGSRPKMSLVLPAMIINDSVMDKEFVMMMQIDCEVMDTRILHIKSSSIPPILRVNETGAKSFFPSVPTRNHTSPTVGVFMGSA